MIFFSEDLEQRRLTLDLEALPAAAITSDSNGEVIAANAGALELLPDDPRGSPLESVLPRGELPVDTDRWRLELTGDDGVPFLVDTSDSAPPPPTPGWPSCCAWENPRC